MKEITPRMVAVSAFLILACVTLVMSWRTPKRVSAQLPDGSILTLEYVKVGRPSQVPNLSPLAWLSQLPFFPRRPWHAAWLNEGLHFWISRQDQATDKYLGFDWWSHTLVLDSHGCSFEDRDHRIDWNSGNGAGRPLPTPPPNARFAFARGTFRSFPRREKNLKLRFFNYQSRAVAEFEIPNPEYRSYPVWRPHSAGAVSQDGSLSFTLTGLTNRLEVTDRDNRQREVPRVYPNFRVLDHGQPTEDWEATETHLLDATGNPGTTADFWLCTNEPAWKLRAVFYRKASARFASNELWRIPGVRIPSAGAAQALSATNLLQNHALKLCAVAGPSALVNYSNGIPISAVPSATARGGSSVSGSSSYSAGRLIETATVDRGESYVMVHAPAFGEHLRLSLRVRDEHGRETEALPSGGFNQYRFFNLNLSTNAAVADLTFLVQKRRVAEFLIPPPALASSEPLSPVDRLHLTREIPRRDPRTPPRLIDLSDYFNVALSDSVFARGPLGLHASAAAFYTRRALPAGVMSLAGAEFDVRGVIQLAGLSIRSDEKSPRQAGQVSWQVPDRVEGIQVNQKCRRLHFLHGAIWSVQDGTEIGQIRVRFVDGQEMNRAMVYGEDVRDWNWAGWANQSWSSPSPEVSHAVIAWPKSEPDRRTGLLYKLTWENPRPDVGVKSIDYVSNRTSSAPFLIAITSEPE